MIREQLQEAFKTAESINTFMSLPKRTNLIRTGEACKIREFCPFRENNYGDVCLGSVEGRQAPFVCDLYLLRKFIADASQDDVIIY